MDKWTEPELSELLGTCVRDLHTAIAVEVQTLGTELSNHLALHFADAIAQSCAKLHNEKLLLQQQLEGRDPGHDFQVMRSQTESNVSDISSSAPLYYKPSNQHKVSDALSLGVPPLRLETVRSGGDPGPDEESEAVANLPNDANEVASENSVSVHSSASHIGENGIESQNVKGTRTSQLWRADMSDRSLVSRKGKKACVYQIVTSKYFEGLFNVIIVLNCFTMGIEANQIINPVDVIGSLLEVGEHVLTALFLLELILRMQVFGWRSFVPGLSKSKDVVLNFMDAFLVLVTGVLFSWVMPVLAAVFKFDTKNDIVRTLTVLRAVRLLRLVRVFQRVPAFREAWLLLRGLTDSVRTLFWTCFVIMFITYIFAIFGMVGLTKPLNERLLEQRNDPERYEELSELMEYVGGLDLLMITLIQLLTMDSWNAFLRKMLKELPFCWVYFYAYIAVAVFVLMNLVTAIIVNNALDNAKVDEEHIVKQKEKVKKEELKCLEELFERMDTDGSGTLNWQEFKDAFADPEMSKKWKLLDFEPDECKELFGLLDDGDGEIETMEFFEGLAKMKGSAQSKDIFRLQKTVIALSNALLAEHKSIRPGGSPPKKGANYASDSNVTREHTTSKDTTPRIPLLVTPQKDIKDHATSSLHRHIQEHWSKLSHDRTQAIFNGHEESSSSQSHTSQNVNGHSPLQFVSIPGSRQISEGQFVPVPGSRQISEGVRLITPSKTQMECSPRIPLAAIQNPGQVLKI